MQQQTHRATLFTSTYELPCMQLHLCHVIHIYLRVALHAIAPVNSLLFYFFTASEFGNLNPSITINSAIFRRKSSKRGLKMSARHPKVPGHPTSTATSVVETAAAAVQKFCPINNMHQHLCAFHFYAHDMKRQVEAHHFCGHQNEEVRQCLIYDGSESDARLIGVEYIISEALFLTLPDKEKPLWHSHEYEVKSGALFMPAVPGPIERQDLAKLAQTYGKAIHFWQVDRGDNLPLGLPQIMMALTRDGQLHDHLAKDVEKRFNVNFNEERENRAYMKGPEHGIHPLANGGGKGLQTVLREVDCKPPAAAAAAGASAARIFV